MCLAPVQLNFFAPFLSDFFAFHPAEAVRCLQHSKTYEEDVGRADGGRGKEFAVNVTEAQKRPGCV